MKDALGLYYFPNPVDHGLRVYVRRGTSNQIEFRLWREDLPEIWEKHPWLPHDVIALANDLYRKERDKNANNLAIYDCQIANTLLTEEENKAKSAR